MKFKNVVRKGHGKRGAGTLGAKAAAKVAGANWRTFKDGIENEWIVPQATIYPALDVKLKRKPIHGFALDYLEELKAKVFKGTRQGRTVWDEARIAAAKALKEKWRGRSEVPG
jgi:hypothetical protein